MTNEKVALDQSFMAKTKPPPLKIHILVVDDDATTLAIVSAKLKSCCNGDSRIELAIVTVKCPIQALSIIRMQKGMFDLVVSDLHMPGMTGMELRHHVAEEFKLPVVIMSSDDNENIMLKSLEEGAAFYLVKPVTLDDLKHVWQYAVATKKGNNIVVEQTQNVGKLGRPVPSVDEKITKEEINSGSSVNDEKSNGKREAKKRGKKRDKDDQEDGNPVVQKKAKVVWTNSLHNLFLMAISHLGLDKAVPKKILELMDVPGLTRENIASHLQKYRIFLKRVAESGALTSKVELERVLRSSFAAGHSSLILGRGQPENCLQINSGQQQLRTSTFQPGLGGNNISTSLGSSSFSPQRFTSLGASASNYVTQFGFGESRIFNKGNGFQQPVFGNDTNPLHQLSRAGFSIGSSTNAATNMSSLGGMTYSCTNGTTSTPMLFQQQNQARSNYRNIGNTNTEHFSFGATGIGSSNGVNPGIGGNNNMPHFTFGTTGIISNSFNGVNCDIGGKTKPPHFTFGSTGLISSSINGVNSGVGGDLVSSSNNSYQSTTTSGNGYVGMQLIGNGDLFGAGQMLTSGTELSNSFHGGNGQMNWTASVASMGSGTFGYSDSSAGFESACKFQPALNSGNHASASILPPISQQQQGLRMDGGGANNITFGLINNAPTTFNSSISNHQQLINKADHGDLYWETVNLRGPYALNEGGEEALSNSFANNPYNPGELNDSTTSMNELLNNHTSSFHVGSSTCWNGQSSSNQLQGGEELVNPSVGSNGDSVNDYFPSFKQQQEGSGGHGQFMDSKLSSVYQVENALAADKTWGDDFMDSLLGDEGDN